MARFLLAFLLSFVPPALVAGEARPVAADPVLEARVMRLAEELRCLVCQNQTLADSAAPLAEDLKNQVREMMSAGKTDAEVVRYMVARYGDFVLYRPPLKPATILLWAGPLLLVAFSLAFLVRRIRGLARQAAPVALGNEERSRADEWLHAARGKENA